MLHVENDSVRKLLLKGNFGLEKECLRITPEGTFAHTPHPFPGDPHIVRDFCENQTEINTDVYPTAGEAIAALYRETVRIQKCLYSLSPRELLWPFSNPPIIQNEEDIPIARFHGAQSASQEYREYLAERYGRYKMTFSGIHINYSFAAELLEADFALSRYKHFQDYKDALYIMLAEQSAAYGWLMTALTAASPLLDNSYMEKGAGGQTVFNGLASTRCSELGYWNTFTPVFDYTNIRTYADSIRFFVEEGLLAAPRELYYPIRLKPEGVNSLIRLRENGVNHIELRMIDLNPLERAGLHVKDLQFAQLFLVWLAGTSHEKLSSVDQAQAVQNFQNAAHYDLKIVKIIEPGGHACFAVDAALKVLAQMKDFYRGFAQEVQDVLAFEEQKLTDPQNRYAWIIRRTFADGFVEKGLELAENQQQEALNNG